jgi:poly(hydroxyalkanoate) depolymerase family esterase
MTKTRRELLGLVGSAALGLSAASGGEAAAGQFTDEYYDGRLYKQYVPTSYDGSSPVPLVVMLHGCTQSPGGFAGETGMNEVAEQEGFVAIYPDQTGSANTNECWNWFEPADQTRGSGEPALIAGMTQQTIADYAIDTDAVFAAGFSAGGAMVPIMAAAYPDIYRAVAVHSGLEYDAADSLIEANTAMTSGGPDPQQKGRDAYEAMGSRARPVPTIVFHGTSDYTVDTVNGQQAAEQATQTADLAADDTDDGSVPSSPTSTTTKQSTGHSYTISRYADDSGEPVVAKYIVDGMGHAWSGGTQGGAYTDPDGPDASRIVWDFFAARAGLGDGGDDGGGDDGGGDDGGGDDGGDDSNTAPTADATASPATAAPGESVSFDASGSTDSDGSLAGYDWAFGDGTAGSGATVSHSYDSAGSYTATVTVTDDDGATDAASVTVTVESADTGYCGTTTNYQHGEAGRATQSATGAYYAVGSDDYMGFPAYESTLQETSPGYFEVVTSC